MLDYLYLYLFRGQLHINYRKLQFAKNDANLKRRAIAVPRFPE